VLSGLTGASRDKMRTPGNASCEEGRNVGKTVETVGECLGVLPLHSALVTQEEKLKLFTYRCRCSNWKGNKPTPASEQLSWKKATFAGDK
jgi:hypothetical protein